MINQDIKVAMIISLLAIEIIVYPVSLLDLASCIKETMFWTLNLYSFTSVVNHMFYIHDHLGCCSVSWYSEKLSRKSVHKSAVCTTSA